MCLYYNKITLFIEYGGIDELGRARIGWCLGLIFADDVVVVIE